MTWTNGTAYRVVVRCVGNTITNYAYANSGNQAAHALKFTRMAAAYAVELGSE